MWVIYFLLLCMILLTEHGKTAYGQIGPSPSKSNFYRLLAEENVVSNANPGVQYYISNLHSLAPSTVEQQHPMEQVAVQQGHQVKRSTVPEGWHGRKNKKGGRGRKNKKGGRRRMKQKYCRRFKPGQEPRGCKKFNLCSNVRCESGAECNMDKGECECKPGYTGDPKSSAGCQNNLCINVHCKPGAECSKSTGECYCKAGYTGDPKSNAGCQKQTTAVVSGECNIPTPDGFSIEKVEKYLLDNIDPQSIRKSLRRLTKHLHLAGTEGELELSQWVADTWQKQGMDKIHIVPYHVLLSYPSQKYPNLVRMLDTSGSTVWKSAVKQEPLYAPEEGSPEIPFTFNAYGRAGNIIGDIVYAGFGRASEFDYLESVGIQVAGRIVLIRYGKAFRANTATIAENRGAIGVIFYSDPLNYAPSTPDDVYPRSVLLPPSGVQNGVAHLQEMKDGDKLTPYYPSTEGAFYITEDEAGFPLIPIQPINYRDAWSILSCMGGPIAPPEWQGGLNITYHLGPQLKKGWKVNLEVHNSNKPATTQNVVGIIHGAKEPDRYVILGGHIDAWYYGATDGSSGIASMMEVARIMLKLKKETGWRPRRSIVFAAWGCEEYGLMGSVEWTEQFGKQLTDRTLAYLNAELTVEGNYTLRMKAAPLLHDMIIEATKKIPNPDPMEVEAGRTTVYDTWAFRRPDPKNPQLPWVQLIDGETDYSSFQHNLGIPSLDLRYTQNKYTIAPPMYHTLYDTFEVVDELYDRGFHFQKAIAVLWGYLALTMADSLVIPFSIEKYANFVNEAYGDIIETHGDMIAAQNITMKYLHNACQNFIQKAQDFRKIQANLNTDCPLAVRHMNDQLMMVERAFIDHRGLPGRPAYNHIMIAPALRDTYSTAAFAGLTDTLAAIINPIEEDPEDVSELWRTFHHHLSAVTHFVDTAAKVLTDDLW